MASFVSASVLHNEAWYELVGISDLSKWGIWALHQLHLRVSPLSNNNPRKECFSLHAPAEQRNTWLFSSLQWKRSGVEASFAEHEAAWSLLGSCFWNGGLQNGTEGPFGALCKLYCAFNLTFTVKGAFCCSAKSVWALLLQVLHRGGSNWCWLMWCSATWSMPGVVCGSVWVAWHRAGDGQCSGSHCYNGPVLCLGMLVCGML